MRLTDGPVIMVDPLQPARSRPSGQLTPPLGRLTRRGWQANVATIFWCCVNFGSPDHMYCRVPTFNPSPARSRPVHKRQLDKTSRPGAMLDPQPSASCNPTTEPSSFPATGLRFQSPLP